jgi:hypothetical protein
VQRLTGSFRITALVVAAATGLALTGADLSVATADDPPSVSAADEELRDQVIGGFETPLEGWAFNRGGEFPGAEGSFDRVDDDPHDGLLAGRLRGDFTDGGRYVALHNNIVVDAREVSFWVRSSDASFVILRMVDDTGQSHQQRLPVQPDGQWHEVEVQNFDGGVGYEHWGGANDGVWHGPAHVIRLQLPLAALAGQMTGEVVFDNVAVAVPPPTLEFHQVEPGNIFVGDDVPRIGIGSTGDTVEWTATDFWGAQVASGSTVVDGPVEIELPVDANGHYELDAVAYRDGEQIGTGKTTFARLSDYDFDAVQDSAFGVSTHFKWGVWGDPAAESLELAKLAGVKSIREGGQWEVLEREPGVYNFGPHDAMAAGVEANGMNWLVLSNGYNPNYDNAATPYTEAAQQALADSALARADHHFPGPMTWMQVYNEPNTAPFGDRKGVGGFDGDCDATVECYLGILKKHYETVKPEHPDLPIVSAGFVGVGRQQPTMEWMEELFRQGGLEYMDVLAIHTYTMPAEPESIADGLSQVEDLVREYNDGELIPIWVTENGFPTYEGAYGVDLATQATYVPQMHAVNFAAGAEKLFYYSFMNDRAVPDPDNREHHFGLIRNTGDARGRWTPKPAYVAYAAMTRELTGAEFAHTEDGIGAGVSSYVFDRNDGQQTHVLWADEPTTIAVETDAPVKITDLMGESQTLTPMAGRVYVSAGENVIYVTGTDLTASASQRFSLSAAPGVTGEDLGVTLTVDNTSDPRIPLTGTLELEGSEIGFDVRPSQRVEIPITLDAPVQAGSRELAGRVSLGWGRGRDRVAGRLIAPTTVIDPISLRAAHVLDSSGTDALRVSVANAGAAPKELGDAEWRIDDSSGTAALPDSIQPGETVSVDVPLADLAPGDHTYRVSIDAPGQPTLADDGKLIMIDPASFEPATSQTIVVDGTADDLSGARVVDLAAEGTVAMDGHGGDADLSGDVAVTWDEHNLYLSATITDDQHTQDAVQSGQIWAGDSIQFAVSEGTPGEAGSWYEYGIGLTSDGPVVHRWSAASGNLGTVSGADVAITRDAATTTYELALPWDTHLAPIEPGDGLLSFSMLVNDNDGSGRKGWIEWGSGIGSGKNPSLFKAIRLEPSA